VDTKNTENIKKGLLRKGLSPTESILISRLAGEGKNILKLKDIRIGLECSYSYAKKIASRLAKKKWLIPLGRGRYLISPLSAGVEGKWTEHGYIIAAHLVEPYYIAYWNALNFYGYTEQTPMSTTVATTKRVKNRTILNSKYFFVALKKSKFFGIIGNKIGGALVKFSDKEKTIIDCLDHPEYCGGISEVAKGLRNAAKEISFEKLVGYAEKMNNGAIFKRLGYLLEELRVEIPEALMKRIKSRVSKGYSYLDPVMPKKGRHNSKWNLIININEKRLEEEGT